jgi:transcriptional regulator with XRE-family HTH domain
LPSTNSSDGTPGVSLRALRERLNISQSELARRSGVSQSRISRLEKHPEEVGAAQPGTLSALAAGLGVGVEQMRDAAGLSSLSGVSETARRIALAADRLTEEHRLLYLALIEHEAGKDRP